MRQSCWHGPPHTSLPLSPLHLPLPPPLALREQEGPRMLEMTQKIKSLEAALKHTNPDVRHCCSLTSQPSFHGACPACTEPICTLTTAPHQFTTHTRIYSTGAPHTLEYTAPCAVHTASGQRLVKTQCLRPLSPFGPCVYQLV